MWLTVLRFLGRYWWQALAGFLVVWASAYVAHLSHSRDAYKAEAAKQALAASQARATLKIVEDNARRSRTASEELQGELEALKHLRAGAPPASVRCRVSAPARPAETDTPAGRDGPAPGAGPLPEAPGHDTRDVGADLYGLVDEADDLSARLRQCQSLLK